MEVEREITLDAPQRLVIGDVFISEANDRLAFNSQGVILQSLVLRRGDLTAAILRIFSTKLQLLYSLVVFRAQTIYRVGRKLAICARFLDPFERCLIRFQPRQALLFIRLCVGWHSKLSNQHRQRQAL